MSDLSLPEPLAKIKRCADAVLDLVIMLHDQGFDELEIYLALRQQTIISRRMCIEHEYGPESEADLIKIEVEWDRMLKLSAATTGDTKE